MTLIILLIAAAAGVAVFVLGMRVSGKASSQPAPKVSRSETPAAQPASKAAEKPAFENEATAAVFDECFKLAFGVQRFDYEVTGPHAAVLAKVNDQAAASVHQREYFPRRPMLLPRLMRVLNDDDATRREIVQLILEDPALAGSVLQRANSAAYRYSPVPVDSLDRAVVMLGVEGLRSLLATAILQPVFRQPKGYFDNFAIVTWEHARRSAAGAEACARALGNVDPFVAQLLGLIGPLARIVLFRLTTETYREWPDLLPRAEVFIRAIQHQSANVAGFIAATWQLSDPSIRALQEQTERVSPAEMSPLGRVVYFSNLCGALALLATRGNYSVEGAQAMLIQQGLNRETMTAIWNAAMAANED
ncbi:MAG: HDOD domain-containing protein [Steroidobacter sp.]